MPVSLPSPMHSCARLDGHETRASESLPHSCSPALFLRETLIMPLTRQCLSRGRTHPTPPPLRESMLPLREEARSCASKQLLRLKEDEKDYP
mmetsp:Transcript_7355/g.17936  ORF Transcript_7355/g.17936 Transcript_7355/m.17936 type:complete len:92 (+) Transcript_7355:1913-2188(+)